MMERFCIILLTTAGALPSLAAERGHVDDFAMAGVSGWEGGTGGSNPMTGGVGGAGDGFLRLAQSFAGHFGARTSAPAYTGSWTAAGIQTVSLYLNDIEADQAFEIHVLISDVDGPAGTTWQYNVGFQPPNGSWQKFTVNVASSVGWTRTRGSASFESVLSNVGFFHIRHDLPPFVASPNSIAGELGIDRVRLGPVCAAVPQDADSDGDVDVSDFSAFQVCFNGPGMIWSAPPADQEACACMDVDEDLDVDVADFAAFQVCFNGAGNPPAC